MLPKRLPVEAVLVEGEGSENNIAKDSSSVFKKHRVDCYLESTAANSNKKTSSVIGNCSDISRESGGAEEKVSMALGDSNPSEIDEDLHSRQLAVYGRETMRRLFASNVLVSGMQGLGVEIAKNLVLAGVKSVTLHDEGVVELWDLSSNFVFSEKDVGTNRALASVQKLQELNNAVVISTLTTELTKEHLSKFQAVVFTDVTFEKAIEFNDYCHDHKPPISFIKAEVRGLFGSIFCDFGPEFTVFDVDGEEPHTGIIASISNDNPALVSCVDDERLEFQDGDLVAFSEVKGMTELNDGKPRKIKNARAYSFFLEEDTSDFGIYEKGGIVTQVKEPKVLNFKTLREAIKDPGDFLLSDFSKFDRPPLLHLAFQALDKFVSEMGRFPVAGSEEDAQKLVSLASLINENSGDGRVEDINPKLLRHFAFGARAVLNPMAAMFGGIVGQEVVKACSGKFHPLFQFFYFDSVESLPTANLDPSEFMPLNSRHDAQISVFGSNLQKKLEGANLFVVGSGALGCEFLKNLALMGVSCGEQGKLTLTDDDVIEKSNLSRQFLFRDWNIGQAKSTVAASAAALINPHLKIEALQNRVGAETENVFDDTFWENLTVTINALDNVNARLYVDQRCLYFQKPLLESGTRKSKKKLKKPNKNQTKMTPSNNLFASIDMGTNSFKMLIIQTDKTGKFLTIDRHKDPVCLGRGFSSSISKESLFRAVTCLKRFNQVLKANKIPPQQAICVATATVREASNVFDFKRSVLESIGFEVSVLSGEEEARFVYLGVLQFLPVFDKRVLVIDIGGGSTEFVIGERGNVVLGVSLKLGHVGLTQKFGKDWNLMEMREFVKLVIKESELAEKVKDLGGFEVVVGTSGTVRAIERAVFNGYGKEFVEGNEVLLRDCKREWKFSRGELSGVVERVCREGEEERVKRDGFFKRRSEFIVAGSVLLEEIFEAVGIEEMEVSEYALGEGVIAETLSKVFEGYDLNANARWHSAVRLATRFSGKKGIKSAAQCSSIAKEIFEGLRKWGEVAGNQINVFLDVKDLECLEAACLLHNIGLITGKKGYHKQSYHIIMNGNHLQGYSAEEVKLIALLTRHHRKKFPKFDGGSLQEFAEELKQKFRVLCAIIRLSVVLQQSDGLNFQDMEFLHSQEGFKLIFREAGAIASFPLPEDMGKELRNELENFKIVFQQNLLLEVLPE